MSEYELAVKKAKQIGGEKYKDSDFGGGIIIHTYNVQDTINRINELKKIKKMKAFQIPNYRIFKVKYLGATNTLGGRVKIEETARYYDDKNRSVTFSYDYSIGDVLEQAFKYLTEKGFKVVARASEYNHYYLLADNWSDNFIELK